tara:strand:+ start:298 stop:429 length:132 start_codon:yes stop_codon:yes gene_type:complete
MFDKELKGGFMKNAVLSLSLIFFFLVAHLLMKTNLKKKNQLWF